MSATLLLSDFTRMNCSLFKVLWISTADGILGARQIIDPDMDPGDVADLLYRHECRWDLLIFCSRMWAAKFGIAEHPCSIWGLRVHILSILAYFTVTVLLLRNHAQANSCNPHESNANLPKNIPKWYEGRSASWTAVWLVTCNDTTLMTSHSKWQRFEDAMATRDVVQEPKWSWHLQFWKFDILEITQK